MAEKASAYGKPTADTARRTWDKDEYRKRAEEKDEAAREHAREAEKAMKKGQKPRRHRKVEDLPKPTEKMRAREGSLELDKNLGKTMIVAAGSRGAGAPGFFCEVCSRNYKDSVGYLDHLNSRAHLRHLGQSTRQSRSTLNQVRAKIANLRAETAAKANAKKVDFATRLKEIRLAEQQAKADRKAAKKAAKQQVNAVPDGLRVDPQSDMAVMMGFGGFR